MKKKHLWRCWDCFSLLDWIVAVFLLLKLPPTKLESWFVLWRFFLMRLLFVSINLPPGLAWNTVIKPGLLFPVATWMLGKLKKRVCRTFGPSLAASLEFLLLRRDVASWSLFYRYDFGRCLFELAELVLLPHFRERCTCYPHRLPHFLQKGCYFSKPDYANEELVSLKKINLQHMYLQYLRILRFDKLNGKLTVYMWELPPTRTHHQ